MATLVGKKCLGRCFHGTGGWNRGMELGDSMVDVIGCLSHGEVSDLKEFKADSTGKPPILDYPIDFPIRSMFQLARLR